MKKLIEFLKARELPKPARRAVCWVFPLLLIFIAELAQMQSFGRLFSFVFSKTTFLSTIFLFDILFVYLIYSGLLLLLRRGWLAAGICGAGFYSIAVVEYYKYKASGAHFDIFDLFMAGNLGELTKFGGVSLNPWIIVLFILLVIYILALWWFKIRLSLKKRWAVSAGAGCLALVAVIVATPFAKTIYNMFNITSVAAFNPIDSDQKFKNNEFLAFLIENTSQKINNVYTPPTDAESAVKAALLPAEAATSEQKPNVIFVMSESFADFRGLFPNVSSEYYSSFDDFREAGRGFTAIVPTFGSSTTRTEFELLFGLPVRSLFDSSTPQNELKTRERQHTFAGFFAQNGYSTVYVHPFDAAFYGRDRIYSTFGFDKMLFRVDLQSAENYREYISDKTIFKRILSEIRASEQPLYLHTSTMQNHQPYNLDPSLSEYDYYMAGIKETNSALGELKRGLEMLDEPTMLVFLGDHLPNFVENDEASLLRAGRTFENPYSSLGLTTETAHRLYRQSAFVWANFDCDLSGFSGDLSAFYLPHLAARAAGGGLSAFSATVLAEMKNARVYASNYHEPSAENAVLDLLTWDVVKGDVWSGK